MSYTSGRNQPDPHSALVARDEQVYEDIDEAFKHDGWGISDALIGAAVATPLCIAVLVYFGDVANLKIARWALEIVPGLTRFVAKAPPAPEAPPVRPSSQDAAVSTASETPVTTLPATAPPSAMPSVDQVSPAIMQLREAMARDLADLTQQIERLKASQEKIADNDARVAEQVKTIQEQLDRIVAAKASERVSEQYDRSPNRPVAPRRRAVSRPVRAVPPPQAAATE
jgi:predicted RNA-binding protein